jgi:hypothetical protein
VATFEVSVVVSLQFSCAVAECRQALQCALDGF